MDPHLWNSRLASAKRQYSSQRQQRDSPFHDDVRLDFPCPYCYEDHDIASLCSHLDDEHSSESKATVCPICSVKVSQDLSNHIMLQHGHLFKLQRHRRLRRAAIPSTQALSLLGRDLHEAHLQVLLGGGGYRSSNTNASTAVSDSLLSQLILNFPQFEVEDISKYAVPDPNDVAAKVVETPHFWKSSFDSSLSQEEREQKIKLATMRAAFMQDVLLSALFCD